MKAVVCQNTKHTVKELPEPGVQVEPASVEYCQLAPASKPPIAREGLLVRRSVVELPVSATSAKVGRAGAAVSMLKAAKLSSAAPVLAARSICRACTWPLA